MRKLAILLLAACGGDDTQKPPDAAAIHDTGPAPDADPRTTVADVPVVINRDVDVLFMIDDSPSMLDKQNNLKANFPNFIDVLNQVPGGLPNLHLGVVTSDLGTSAADGTTGPSIGSSAGACMGQGKAGALRTSTSIQGNFISDVATGSTRVTNYTGTLADAFSSLASVGQTGCGFEQSLEAVKRALNNNPANAGFLRPSAKLAVVFLTDEDDCSFAHSSILTQDTGTYGPLSSFRCTRFGVTCDVGGQTTDAMNQAGDKNQCHSNESGTDLTAVASYTSFLKGLKANPDDVIVSGIIGPTTPFQVASLPPPGQPSGTPVPTLQHSCTYVSTSDGTEVADPPVRLKQAIDAMGGSWTTICQNDLSDALHEIAGKLVQKIGDPCLSAPIAQPADCEAFDVVGASSTAIAACPGGPPCFSVAADPVSCPNLDHLKLTVDRGATTPPAGTHVVLKCKT